MRVLAFAAAIPFMAVCVRAEEPEKPAYISIEILDASGNSLMDSVTEQDGLLIWSGTASLTELPPEKKEEPVVLKGNSRKRNNVPLYFQNQYPDVRYGSGSVATSGCSITSLAMVASYMTDHLYSPAELADYFGGSAYSNMARLEAASDALQLPWKKAINWHESLQALKDGKVVIALVEEASVFTESQHFIVLTGMTDDGKILVNDPNLSNYARWELQKGFVEGFTEGDILCGYSGGWIYDKAAMPQEPFLYYEEEVIRESRYPGLTLTTEDLDLLAKVVWVESQGECFEGQQAVAEVVLNRLLSEKFPDDVRDIVFQENQFRSLPFLGDAEPGQAQYQAIEKALFGPYVLDTDVFYFAREKTNNNVWGTIGNHIFCREEK